MSSLGIKMRLAQWGRWARGGMPSLPTMSSIEKARSGRGGTPNTEMPPHIAEIDHIICISPADCRQVLIVYYAQQGRVIEKAARIGVSRWTFRDRLERGESFVALNL